MVGPGYAAFTVLARLHVESGTVAANGIVTARAREGTH